jgi:hypothetical protein
MVEIVYLQSGEPMPDLPKNEPWLIVEASNDGRFFGTGCGFKPSGESLIYLSMPEDDATLEAALAAATGWAQERGVPRIWVQTSPD